MGEAILLSTTEGEPFEAYRPGSDTARGAVLILHEWSGLKPHNRQWADRLADAGYLALLIEL